MHTNFDNNAEEEYLPNQWINWCRLCAMDDDHHSINIFQDSSKLNNENEYLSLHEALDKYFGVKAYTQDNFPKMLCTNCVSLISFMIDFNKRVERVQLMYSKLAEVQNNSSCIDLNSVRLKFKLAPCEEDQRLNNLLSNLDYASATVISTNESNQCFPNGGKLKVQIKQEENVETLLNLNYNKFLEQDMDHQDKAAIFENDSNDLLSENEEDPFQLKEEENEASTKEDTKTNFQNLHQSEKEYAVEKNKLDRGKKKRKRKKFKQFSSKDCFKKKSLIKDIKMEANCKECGNSFSKYMLYREHMQEEHNHSKGEKHWPCPSCDKILLSLYNLERHVRIHVPLEVRQTFKCNDCESRYTSNAQLETHIRYKHKNEKPFICEECGLCLRTNSNLRQHMLIHTDLAPYECEVCKKKFKNKTRLKTHMDIHSPNKHICNICGLQLNSRATLNRHFLVHSDDMQHKCDYCGKAFKRAKALKNHLLLHTGLKPYSCDFCERTFANGSNCRSHMKKMHPEELAILEASGNKTHTKNIPKLETLKAVTKAADNLTPVVTKSSGCFAFGKKPKDKDDIDLNKSQKLSNKPKIASSLSNGNEKLKIKSPSSTPLDLQYMPLGGSSTTTACLPPNKHLVSDLSSSSTTSAPIPNFDNIYQHLLKQSQTDLQIEQPLTQISPTPLTSDVSTPQHNPFYQDIMSHCIKPPASETNDDMLQSPISHRSSMTPLAHEDHSNASSINGQFYGSIKTTLPPGNFM